jgi:hypothetical protein
LHLRLLSELLPDRKSQPLRTRENILYGSPYPGKRLDIYLPPSSQPDAGSAEGSSIKARTRKHSTLFAEGAPSSPSNGNDGSPPSKSIKAPVVVFIPSPIPPLNWTSKRVSGSTALWKDTCLCSHRLLACCFSSEDVFAVGTQAAQDGVLCGGAGYRELTGEGISMRLRTNFSPLCVADFLPRGESERLRGRLETSPSLGR